MALPSPRTKKNTASGGSSRTGQRSTPAGAQAGSQAEEGLPDKDAIARICESVRLVVDDPRHAGVRHFLERLALNPPQVLLLEGGNAEERLAVARYWSILLNCPSRREGAPCFRCPDCVRMLTFLHRDCFYYDGQAASIKIDEVRALRSVLGEPPREARYRVVIFREAQALGEAAANSLLKSFEEPRPGTSFLMLAPQRERLLPTLVSRSFTLTLPWPLEENPGQAARLAQWEEALCLFMQTGRGFLEKTGARGAVDVSLAHGVVNMCRRALVSFLSGSGNRGYERLASAIARMPQTRLRILDEALAECQDSLVLGVNPALALEWLATRMYFLYPR